MNDTLRGLKDALALSPENHALRLLLAQTYEKGGYPKEALEHYGALLAAGQMHDQALVPAGLLALGTGDVELAQQHLSVARQLGLDASALEDGLERRLKVPASGEADPLRFRDALDEEARLTFKDVGGLDEVKKTIERLIISPFQRPELYAKYGKRAGGGVLMYGPPGCGKTMLARATAGECGLPFFNIRIETILDPYRGASERNLHEAFARARARAPGVLFIDELDAIGFARRKQTSEHARPLVDQLLQELDAIGSDNEGLLIIAATNAPWDIDDAALRPGRFDRRIFVAPPDETARRSILRLHLANRHAERVDEKRLAKATKLFSGADLQALVEQAVEFVIDEALSTGAEPPLTAQHLEAALKDLQPSTGEWLRRARNYVEFANQDKRYEEVARFLRSGEARGLR